MYDIHHHLLPGLDDGPATLADAVAQARLATADGITHVVCTPHENSRFSFPPELVADRLQELRTALADAGIALELGIARDFHISYDNLQAIARDPRRYTVNGGPYLLVELPDHGLPPNLSQTWYDLQLLGLTPILTHPERNQTLQRAPERLANWMRAGMLLQITAASVLGEMGSKAEAMAHELLRKRWVHFLATDAHDTERRPPRLTAAREMVAARYSAAYAQLLCEASPRAVWNGQPMPPHPAMLELFAHDRDDDADIDPPRRAWWRRLLNI